jgi:hypothetical protein
VRGIDADFAPQLAHFMPSGTANARYHYFSRQSVMVRLFGMEGSDLEHSWGSKENPYIITVPEQMFTLSDQVARTDTSITYNGRFFLLAANLDLGEWRSIGSREAQKSFQGTFDGAGLIINYTINDATRNDAGLFGYLGHNGVLTRVIIGPLTTLNGRNYVGGLAAYSAGAITRSYSRATLVAGNQFVGGLIGATGPGAVLEDAYFYGTVSAGLFSGGLIGLTDSTTRVSNAWFISAEVAHIGAGSLLYIDNNGSATVSMNIATGVITATLTGFAGFRPEVRDVQQNVSATGVVGTPLAFALPSSTARQTLFARFTRPVNIAAFTNGTLLPGQSAMHFYEGQQASVRLLPADNYYLSNVQISGIATDHTLVNGEGNSIVVWFDMGVNDVSFSAAFTLYDEGQIEALYDSLEYDGEEKLHTALFGGVYMTVAYIRNNVSVSPRNAGSYTLRVYLRDGSVVLGIFNRPFEIIQRQLTITADPLWSQKQYDNQRFNTIEVTADTGLIAGDDVKLWITVDWGSARNVTASDVLVLFTFSLTGSASANYCGLFVGAPEDCSEGKINKRVAVITINESVRTYEFDGHSPRISSFTSTAVGNVAFDFTFVHRDGLPQGWAGVYDITAVSTTDPNHTAILSQAYTLKILPRTVLQSQLVIGGLEFTFNGAPRGITAQYRDVDNILRSLAIEYDTPDKLAPTDAGKYDATITMPAAHVNYRLEDGFRLEILTILRATHAWALTLDALPALITYGDDTLELTVMDGLFEGYVFHVTGGLAIKDNVLTVTGAGKASVQAELPQSTNYFAHFSKTIKFTVQRAVLTATFGKISTVYDAVFDPLAPFVENLTGFVNGDTAAGAIAVPSVKIDGNILTLTQIKELDAGKYIISFVNTVSPNYIIDFEGASAKLTVTPRPLTLTPRAASKTYGDTDLPFNFTLSEALPQGFTLVGALTRAAGERVGNYAILQGTLTSANNPNYNINFVEGVELVIRHARLFITIENATKVYGPPSNPTPDPTPHFSLMCVCVCTCIRDCECECECRGGLKFNDHISIISGRITRVEGENVGFYPYIGGLNAGHNYIITYLGTGALEITKATPVFVLRPKAAALTFGQNLGAASVSAPAGFPVAGSFVWLNPSFVPNASAQVALYTATFLPACGNYHSVQTLVEILVNPLGVGVVFHGDTRPTYTGNPLMPLTATVTGDNNHLLVQIVPINAVNAGTYTAVARLVNSNYTIVGNDSATFEIVRRAVTVSFAPFNALPGEVPDNVQFFFNSFVGGDTEESVFSAAAARRPAIQSIPNSAGVHRIRASGAQAANYTFVYEEGLVTVAQNALSAQGGDVTGNFTPDARLAIEEVSEGARFNTAGTAARSHSMFRDADRVFAITLDNGSFNGGTVTVRLNLAGTQVDSSSTLLFIDTRGNVTVVDNARFEDGYIIFDAPDLGRLVITKSHVPMSFIAILAFAVIVVLIVVILIIRKVKN